MMEQKQSTPWQESGYCVAQANAGLEVTRAGIWQFVQLAPDRVHLS
ncbi:hypothetical protein [Alkalilacustris brevis]|nr:hypothetical protein [Alkalilacustris brevis]